VTHFGLSRRPIATSAMAGIAMPGNRATFAEAAVVEGHGQHMAASSS
jgi:hypothetical protein